MSSSEASDPASDAIQNLRIAVTAVEKVEEAILQLQKERDDARTAFKEVSTLVLSLLSCLSEYAFATVDGEDIGAA